MKEKNAMTVQDLIDVLETQNKDAVVCLTDMEDIEKTYRSIAIIEALSDKEYVDDSGESKTADIVLLF